jgi:hypothetical protein
MNPAGIQQAIRDAGFEPQYRNQAYEPDELPVELLGKVNQ